MLPHALQIKQVKLQTLERLMCTRCGTSIGNLFGACTKCGDGAMEVCLRCCAELQGCAPPCASMPKCPRAACKGEQLKLRRVLSDDHQRLLERFVAGRDAAAPRQPAVLDGTVQQPGVLRTAVRPVRFHGEVRSAPMSGAPSAGKDAAAQPAQNAAPAAVAAGGHAADAAVGQAPGNAAAVQALWQAAKRATFETLPQVLQVCQPSWL